MANCFNSREIPKQDLLQHIQTANVLTVLAFLVVFSRYLQTTFAFPPPTTLLSASKDDKAEGEIRILRCSLPQSLSDHREKNNLTCRAPAVRVQLPACVCAAERVQSVGAEIVSLHKECSGHSNCYIWGIVTCKQGKQWCFQTLQKSKILASSKHGWTL